MSNLKTKKELFLNTKITDATAADRVAQARELLLEYGRFVVSQAGPARFCFGSLEKEAAPLPLSYYQTKWGGPVARVEDKPAGFVAWREFSPNVAPDAWEMKRMWVPASGSGVGLGRALTVAVLERAATAGRKAIYLDTVPATMGAAHHLYLSLGFTPCAPYNDNPVDGIEYLVKYL